MENTYLIALVREALPLWDQRDKKYHTRDLKPKLRDKMEEKLKFTGKYWDGNTNGNSRWEYHIVYT